MKYIITGGCGFVGRNFIAFLLKQGILPSNIKIIDNFSVGKPEDLAPLIPFNITNSLWNNKANTATLVQADVRDINLMYRAISNANVVVHLAGSTGVVPALKDPVNDCTSNVIGTLNVLEAMKRNKIKRIIYSSSGAPLGKVCPPLNENSLPEPISAYGASKLACEGYCRAYSNCFGIESIILRFSNLYGPFSEKKISIVANFFNNALRGNTLELHGEGTVTRDFLYTNDLSEAIFLACTKKELKNEIFQIATGQEISILHIVKLMLNILTEYGYDQLQIKKIEPRSSDIERSYSTVNKANTLLGWKAQYSLEKGLQETLEWFIKYCAKERTLIHENLVSE